MKRFLLLFTLLSSQSFAQGGADSAVQDTLYFDQSYGVSGPEQAEIIRVIYGKDSAGYIFKEFDKNGNLKKSGITEEQDGRPAGMIATYYDNGVKKDEGYLDKMKKGLWKEWYQNGLLKNETEYSKNEKGWFNAKLINFYDSVGNMLVADGEGLFEEYYQNNVEGQLKTRGRYRSYNQVGEWEGFHENGDLYYKESYSDSGGLIKGTSYDLSGKRFDYSEPGVQPSPVGGMENLYRFIVRKLKYPKTAAKNGVQGRVYVQFVVDRDGSITEAEAVKGISKECDEEAVRVVKILKPWNPGIQRGQPVKVRMIFPIVFKIP